MKNGKHVEEYTGLLLGCDRHLNLNMGDVRITKEGSSSYKREAFVRGTGIKGIRLEKGVIADYMQHKEDTMNESQTFETSLLRAETLEKLRLLQITKGIPQIQIPPNSFKQETKLGEDFSKQKSLLII